MLWVYPLPENVGLVLDVDAGNRVQRVLPGSPAESAGLQAGDVLTTIGTTPIRSQADCMFALHLAPQQGDLTIHYQRHHQAQQATISLQYGWKKSNFLWRPSARTEKVR